MPTATTTQDCLPMLCMWRELLTELADIDAHPTDRAWRTDAEVVKSLAEREYARWLDIFMKQPATPTSLSASSSGVTERTRYQPPQEEGTPHDSL